MSSTFSGPSDPEYLGSEGPQPSSRRGLSRSTVVAGAAVAVLAAAGAGAWGVYSLLAGGGPAPATAVPASAVGYVSVDLDPSASQKIEAIKILQKFPGLAKQLNLGSQDDLRRYVFEQFQKDGTCKSLSYDKDISPWIGDRLAAAAVPSGSSVYPLVAVQVGDQDAARKAVSALENCAGASKPAGVAFSGDYMLLSDTQKHADSSASEAQKAALQDDTGFQKWTSAAGDPGIVTMYASAKAPKLLLDAERKGMQKGLGSAGSPFASGFNQGFSTGMNQATRIYKSFKGMAAVVRFHDGAVETEFASGGLANQLSNASAADISHLPASTAVAAGMGLQHGWTQQLMKNLAPVLGGKAELHAMLKQGERQTGLKLPGDIETLLGDGVSVALDSSADFKSFNTNPDPSTLPVGLRIKGDPSAIDGVIGKLRRLIGPQASMLKTKDGSGVVAVGLDQKYVDSLAGNGTLGSDPTFTSVVPHADQSTGVLYLNFDAGNGWVDHLAYQLSDGDRQVTSNIAPLHALGASTWVDGDVTHGLVTLSTQ
jgi:hypothetical protein